MRGAFNTTCNVFYGPESPYGPPNVQYAATVPCRLVPQTEIDQDDFPLSLTEAWLTVEALAPNTPKYQSSSLGEWHARIYTSDVLSVLSWPLNNWYAIRREYMFGPDQMPYWRVALLSTLKVRYPDWLPPSPPPPPGPATTCAAATVAPLPISYTGPISSGAPWWFTFNALAGVVYHVTVTVPPVSGGITNVYRGGCGVLNPVAGPMIDSGTLPFSTLLNEQLWVQIQTAVSVTASVGIS